MAIAEALSPAAPDDMEEMDDQNLWGFLEMLAAELSPAYWDDPDAIDELYRLRGMFVPNAPRDDLPPIAKAVRAARRSTPDLSVSPANPEYERMVQRVTAA